MKTLVAQEKAVAKLFSNDYVFNIPGYQRPYAWTRDQAGELLDDLLAAMKAEAGPVVEMSPYFLGSIVLIKADTEPDADVVDGQQRLTTLTLLLAVIRSRLNPTQGAEITPLLYERGNTILGLVDRFRLTLRERDREFFQRYVQREGELEELFALDKPLSDSQKYIRQNALLFEERLSSLTEPELLRLAQYVVTRCYLVAVSTPDLDSAYRIFSVLNSRGLDLSATDILKAEMIGAIPAGSRDTYTHRWEEAEEDLGRDAFSELFSHIRMVYRKAKPKGTLLKEFRDHVTEASTPTKFVDSVLLPMASAFRQIRDSAYESASQAENINDSLRWLNRLEFKDWVPPALAFLVRFRNSPGPVHAFLSDLERLGYAMLAARWGLNARIERFSRLTEEVEALRESSPAALPSLQLAPTEQTELYRHLDGPLYEMYGARARTLILLRLDALLSTGDVTYGYSTISVEHVLPQTPPSESEWVQWIPEPEIRLFWTHRLGNLALLNRSKNSAASNFEFEKKKSSYFATKDGISPFVLTTQVLGKSCWKADVIKERQKDLVAAFVKYWRIEKPG
jgi:hypothetical protein